MVAECGVVALEEQHIFLGLVVAQLAVVGQLDSMGSMVEQHIVVQHKLIVQMDFVELIVEQPFVFELVEEHKLAIAKQVFVAEQLFLLAEQLVSWQRWICSISQQCWPLV